MENEKRLIDANVLRHETCLWCNEHYPDEPCEPNDCPAMQYIDNFPTVDAVEVVHGRWEWRGPYRYNGEGWIGTCSVCKERLRLFVHNYCPNCGTKMDGDGNG